MFSVLAKKGLLFALGFVLSSQASAAIAEINIPTATVKNAVHFTSWQGIEPDKWATLWMIKRYISTNAYFTLVPPNSTLPENAVPFGAPNTAISRANRQSMFRRLKNAFDFKDASLDYLDLIIHDVEVNIWDKPTHPHSIWFETLYRQLQARYDRDQVPIDCYLAFFDGVSRLASQPNITANDYSEQLGLDSLCPGLPSKRSSFVESIDHLNVLREISVGKKVVFVDTREDEEYNEVHLPGSRLIRLRDVDKDSAQSLVDADLVVPYCVKDFRGFEVAKALKLLGVPRVATLSPNGLKGWLKATLPVAKKDTVTEQQSLVALMRCATEPHACIKE